MRQLGGDVIISNAVDMQLGRGEPIEDTARVLSRMVDAMMIRANNHAGRRARWRCSPRAGDQRPVRQEPPLPDHGRPADHRGASRAGGGQDAGLVGDGNNVCASFIHAAPKLGYRLKSPARPIYHPDLLDLARAARSRAGAATDDPREAVKGADAVITDTWVSMGDTDHDERLTRWSPTRWTSADGPGQARRGLPALPARPPRRGGHRRGDRRAQSRIWDEAENRLHAQKSILAWCFGRG